MNKDQRFQAGDWIKPAENAPGPAIETLRKIERVQTAAELHPTFAYADRPWRSLGWGLVTSEVLDFLQRSRAIFISNGFKVDSDPVNPLGDGKSWVFRVEPTRNLPFGLDPLEIARKCQSECVKGAASPVWDGETILILPLWDAGFNLALVRKRRGRPPSVLVRYRRAVIQKVVSKKLAGEAYCRELRRFLTTPGEWQKRKDCLCPA